MTPGTHYGASALWSAGEVGTGASIATLEFPPSSAHDIAAYDARFGVDAANYSETPTPTGTTRAVPVAM